MTAAEVSDIPSQQQSVAEVSSSLDAGYAKSGGPAFSAASLSLRAQKKFASKFATRNMSKLFISDKADRLFDNLHAVLKEYYPKKDAEKVVKNMIKLAVKLAVLSRNNKFSPGEEDMMVVMQKQMKTLAITVISFEKIAYSYERSFFLEQLMNLRETIAPLVDVHLSDNSSKRLDHVLEHLSNEKLIDSLFKVNGPHAHLLSAINRDLESLIDAKQL